MKPIFNKHKYLRVIHFTQNKRSFIEYINDEKQGIPFLVHSDHVFLANGFRSVIITDKSAETINPLDFQSKFDVSDFTSAIESKIVRETFTTIEKKPLDITLILIAFNTLVSIALVYFALKGQGII